MRTLRILLLLILAVPASAQVVNVADYRGDLQAAVKAVRSNMGGVLYLPGRPREAYILTEPLDLRGMGGVTVRGDGLTSIIMLRGERATIDCDGTVTRFCDLRIDGDPRNRPNIGVTFARNTAGASVNGCGMERVRVTGSFAVAVRNLNAELSAWRDVHMPLTNSGRGLVFDTNDRDGTGRVINSGSFTNSGHTLDNVSISIHNQTPDPESFPLVIAGGTDNLVTSGVLWLAGSNIGAYVLVESYPKSFSRGNVPRRNRIDWVATESKKYPEYGLLYRALDGQDFAEDIETDAQQWRACKEFYGLREQNATR